MVVYDLFHIIYKWIPGVITEITGLISYQVTLADGRTLKRHFDQIRTRYDNTPITDNTDQWASNTTDIPILPSRVPQQAVRRSTYQTKIQYADLLYAVCFLRLLREFDTLLSICDPV